MEEEFGKKFVGMGCPNREVCQQSRFFLDTALRLRYDQPGGGQRHFQRDRRSSQVVANGSRGVEGVRVWRWKQKRQKGQKGAKTLFAPFCPFCFFLLSFAPYKSQFIRSSEKEMLKKL